MKVVFRIIQHVGNHEYIGGLAQCKVLSRMYIRFRVLSGVFPKVKSLKSRSSQTWRKPLCHEISDLNSKISWQTRRTGQRLNTLTKGTEKTLPMDFHRECGIIINHLSEWVWNVSQYTGILPNILRFLALFSDTESRRPELIPVYQYPTLIPIRADPSRHHLHRHANRAPARRPGRSAGR